MASLVLGLAGQAIGNALLPEGLTILGQTITGAAIGGAIGAYAGSHVDAMLRGASRVEGPRLKELQVQASTQGAPVPRVWGTMRLAGQIIWAARFRETASRKGGGKAGPRVTSYSYSASFAVGLCEGVIGGIGRVWADGKPMTLDGVIMRIHPGTEDQPADPLIELTEGAGGPAFRGTAYVVFENLPLEPFGNRVPQLSFEVMRPLSGEAGTMEEVVEAVCLIPGSGEFALSPSRVLRDAGRGKWIAENVNNRAGKTDFEASLDQLQAALPKVKRVALVVAWFGDDLRAGVCQIRPGVELNAKRNRPGAWRVEQVTRASAYQVSQTSGRPNYGGTPDDAAAIAAIRALKARGLEVMFYPFILMDVPPGNALPDPYGGTAQGAFPWRGRITCMPAPGRAGSPDMSAAAASQIDAFFDGTWGLRRMIRHYAHLCAEAGGVDAFLIASELRGMTTLRSASGVYPAVAKLKALAAEVRAIVGAETRISYAADWTEWRGHDAGSGAFFFHLDPLWADGNIDFIGVDVYAPLSDRRDGDDGSPYDRAALKAHVEGGEAYDWFYASDVARDAKTRSTISDGAYGKPWIWRAKDFRNWWLNPHHNRPDGTESASATDWVPQSKPFRFTECGFGALDKSTNQPNVFYDPRSSESGLPYFSSGVRDDLSQRAGIEALLGYWREAGRNPASSVNGRLMIETSHAYVWAWDARPFPDWPLRDDVWSDGPLWRTGHWLNGRAGAAPLGTLVREICTCAGLSDVDVTGLRGSVAGYALDRVMSAREALSPLMMAFAIEASESAGRIRFFHSGDGYAVSVPMERLAEAEEGAVAAPMITRAETAGLPGAIKVSFIDTIADYAPGAAEARMSAAPSAKVMPVQLPLAMCKAEAGRVAQRLLQEHWAAREAAHFALPPSLIALEPGDLVQLTLHGVVRCFRLTRVEEHGVRRCEAGVWHGHLYQGTHAELDGTPGLAPHVSGPPFVAVMDVPALAAQAGEDGLFIAAFAEPWPGAVSVLHADCDNGPYTDWMTVPHRAVVGETASSFPQGSLHVWDRATHLDVILYGGGLSRVDPLRVLNGANRAAVETAPGRWEVFQFAEASLIAPDTWRLSQFLRGQAGSEINMARNLNVGARFVLLDEHVMRLPIAPSDMGAVLHLKVGPTHMPVDDVAWDTLSLTYEALAMKPWRVCQLKALRQANGDVLISWVRRARDDPGRWSETEVPLDEAENYRIEIGPTQSRVANVNTPSFLYTAAMQSTDGASSSLPVRITQISARYGAGAPRDAWLAI